MATATQILTANGIVENAEALVQAASTVGVPLWIAAAFVEQESRGRNIYGHDAGGALSGRGAVTQANYTQEFLPIVRSGRTSNGVGPLQITWGGYFKPGADNVANLWRPYDNMVLGLSIIRGNLHGDYSDDSIVRAGRLFNGALPYGYQVLAKAKRWRSLLGGAASTTTQKAPQAASGVLSKGSTGPSVKALQAGLLAHFPAYAWPIKSTGGADGSFGSATDSVVKEFQRRSGLTADGVVGPATKAALAKVGITF